MVLRIECFRCGQVAYKDNRRAMYCSSRCRVAAWRSRHRGKKEAGRLARERNAGDGQTAGDGRPEDLDIPMLSLWPELAGEEG